MTVRPPTIRENRRYILTRILPGGMHPDPKELYFAVADTATSLFGDDAASRIHVAVVAIENGYAFIRCQRGFERELTLALSTVTSCANQRIALRTIAISGTMESLRARVKDSPAPVFETGKDITFDQRQFILEYCESEKIDVVEKGFKNTARFFLTTVDLEDH